MSLPLAPISWEVVLRPAPVARRAGVTRSASMGTKRKKSSADPHRRFKNPAFPAGVARPAHAARNRGGIMRGSSDEASTSRERRGAVIRTENRSLTVGS